MFTYQDNGQYITGSLKHSEEWLEIVKDEEGTITAPEGLVLQIAKEALDATQAEFRAERDVLLAEADIEINKLVDAGLATTVYSEYRQTLRDSTITWVLPTKP